MFQITRSIIEKKTLAPTTWQITVGLEPSDTFIESVEPGQFFLAQCGPLAAFLRRPLFPANIIQIDGKQAIDFIFTIADLADPGMAWLMSRNIGESLDLLGPFGRGFSQIKQSDSLLLIGSGSHIGPLLFLLHRAVQHKTDVVLALESARSTDLFPTDVLPPAAELRLATVDGRLGNRGSILEHIDDLLPWADRVCAVGSLEFYGRLKRRIDETRLHLIQNFANVLLTDAPLHICGLGICTLCAIHTTQGIRLACQDGPIFDLANLEQGMLT